jgi:hypothetical protein
MAYDQMLILQDITKGIESITANLFRLSINQTLEQKKVIQAAQVTLGEFVDDVDEVREEFDGTT